MRAPTEPDALLRLAVRPRPSRPDAASAASEPPHCLTRTGTEAQPSTARPFLALWSLILSVSPLPFTLPVKNAIEASMKTRRRPIEAPWQTFPLPPALYKRQQSHLLSPAYPSSLHPSSSPVHCSTPEFTEPAVRRRRHALTVRSRV
jgi:hypothetical protein